MSPTDLLRRHVLASAAVIGACVGLVIGAVVPPPRPGPGAGRSPPWLAPSPSVAQRATEAEFAAVRAAPLWGDARSAGGAGVKAVSWSLTGIIHAPEPIALVATPAGTQVLRLKVGDPLPDGAVVEGMTPGAVRFVRDGCRFERALYVAADVALDEKCAATPAPAKLPDAPAQ